MLQVALEVEVSAFLETHADHRDQRGNRLVVRNGYRREREVLTGAGPLTVGQSRARDKSPAAADHDQETGLDTFSFPEHHFRSVCIGFFTTTFQVTASVVSSLTRSRLRPCSSKAEPDGGDFRPTTPWCSYVKDGRAARIDPWA
jgi:hypothetical protein